jgi:hypothetical protein
MGNMTAHVTLSRGLVAVQRAGSSSNAARQVPRDLEGIIARTLVHARATGRDSLAQDRAAATAVMAVRPDFSLGQALEAVTHVRLLAFA